MGFFFKLIRELNSSDNEKFITLALVLGLICGFLPFFNVFTLIILFFAFVLRIPFGLYLAGWGVFSVAGYFLDPVFAKTGYYILTAPFLTPLWEFLYNIPLMRWSGYNNTVVAGGLFWGVLIGILLYFVLNKSIKTYRDKVFAFCSKYRFLNWIVPGEVKKKGVVRISGAVSFVIVFGGLFLLISLTFDPFVKTVMQYSMSKLLKKPVKIEKLHTSFLNADVDIKNMYIGDIKTEHINLKLSWKYLVWKKFDIQNLQITNIRSDKTLKEIAASGFGSSKTEKSNIFRFKLNIGIPDPKQLLQGYQLESLQKINRLKKDYKDFSLYVKNIKKTAAEDKTRIEKIKKEIDNLKKSAGNIKSVSDIQSIMAQTEKIKKEIKSIQTDVENQKNKLNTMKKQILKDIKAVKTAGKNDYARLSKKYDLLKTGQYAKFTESFLKPQIQNYVNKAVQYYKIIKPYISKSNKKENKYIRSKGRYIVYKDKIKYPGFVLENGSVSASLKDAGFNVKIKNVSSNQNLLNKKAFITVSSVSKYYKSAKINVDYLNRIDLSYVLKELHLKDIKYNAVILNKAELNAKGGGFVQNDRLNFYSDIILLPEGVVYTKSARLSKILQNTGKIVLNVKISGTIQKYSVAVTSNIDRIFSKLLKKEINRQIKIKKEELNQLLNAKIKKAMSESGINPNNLSVPYDLNSVENSLNGLQDLLKQYSQKELEKRFLKKGIGNFIKF
jgi:uncharacterized protein (TIGR03545 family)/uncharacterized protein (TIGR03546 family)